MQADTLTHRERKKLQRYHDICVAALHLAQERGYEQVTVEDIAAACNISRRTFFNYFDSKEQVYLGHINTEVAPDTAEKLAQSDNLLKTVVELLLAQFWTQEIRTVFTPELFTLRRDIFRATPELQLVHHAQMFQLTANIHSEITAFFEAHPQAQRTDFSASEEAHLIVGLSVQTLNVASINELEHPATSPESFVDNIRLRANNYLAIYPALLRQ
ncbi:MAG: helix-turn-helix domain-containing protein [Corynebacterium sp.]|nr:helix-turn-helix domain-containing protein [Corynebacterium sp.]